MYALVWCILLLFGITNGLIYNRVIFRPRLRKLLSTLDVGDFQNVVFTKTDHIGKYNDIGKYMLDATVTASEMNSFLDEYKEEMMDRKVIFPGFRPGKIPPSAMIDIRKYLVSHCIETIIGQLCNINGLVVCKFMQLVMYAA